MKKKLNHKTKSTMTESAKKFYNERSFILDMVCAQVESLNEISEEEQKNRDNVCDQIERIIQAEYKYIDGEIELFGSSENGFAMKNSDLDICVTFGAWKNRTPTVCIFLIPEYFIFK